MSNNIAKPVMLASLTVQEFRSILTDYLPESSSTEEISKEKRYVYGLKGLAELLDVSYHTAYRIKKSGKLDKAIKQIGRKIIIDVDMTMELLKHPNQ